MPLVNKDTCIKYHCDKGRFTEYIKFTPGKSVSIIHSDDPDGIMCPGKSISIDYVQQFNFPENLEYHDLPVDEFDDILRETIEYITNEGSENGNKN